MRNILITLLFLLILGCSQPSSQSCSTCGGDGLISLENPICTEAGCIIFETCPKCGGTGIEPK